MRVSYNDWSVQIFTQLLNFVMNQKLQKSPLFLAVLGKKPP